MRHQSTEIISKLYAAHAEGQSTAGVDIEVGASAFGPASYHPKINRSLQNEENSLLDAKAQGILDVYSVKQFGIRLATHAAITILSVDQVCVSTRFLLIVKDIATQGFSCRLS